MLRLLNYRYILRWRSIFKVIIPLILVFLEPNALQLATDKFNFEIYTRLRNIIFSPQNHEGRLPLSTELSPIDRPARDHIVVVSATLNSLSAWQTNWPIPHSLHAQLIGSFIDAEVAAIVVDIQFLDKRISDNKGRAQLVAWLEEAKEMGIPVILAKSSPKAQNKDAPNGYLKEFEGLIDPALIEYADNITIPYEYQLKPYGQNSLALLAYQAFCKTYPSHQSCLQPVMNSINQLNHIWLDWQTGFYQWDKAIGVNKNNINTPYDCQPITADKYIGFDYFLYLLGESRQQSCPSLMWLEAHMAAGKTSLPIDKLYKLLNGKIVLYGIDLGGINDHHKVATMGHSINGVYYHATALENLIDKGARQFYAPNITMPLIQINVNIVDLIEFFTLIILLICFWLTNKLIQNKCKSKGYLWLRSFGLHTLISLIILVLLLIAFWLQILFNIAPINFVVCSLIFVLEYLASASDLHDHICKRKKAV